MVLFKTLALAALTTLSIGGVASASSLEEIRRDSMILYENGNAICSTQFVDGNKFLTAAHCVANKEGDYTVKFVDKNAEGKITKETIYHATVDEVNTSGDVATLTIDTYFGGKGVDVATPEEVASLPLGAPVLNSGFPLEAKVTDHTFIDGIYNGVVASPWPGEEDVNYTTAMGVRGNSGGGLYAQFDGEWKLIGTLEGGSQIANFINYYSTIESVHSVIDNE
jgi:V8-like Glu-specific endopeptidase